MNRQWWYRVIVGAVVLLGIFILITLNTSDFGEILPDLPRPADLLSDFPKQMKLLTLSKGGNGNESTSGCECSMKPWHGSEHIGSLFNLTLPWLNHTTTRQDLEQRHPNLPLDLLNGAKDRRCSLLPTIFNIEWVNKHWQVATLDSNDSFFLYSAFFDPETGGEASVRLLGVSRSKSPALVWCHVWYSADAPPRAVKVAKIDYLDYQNRNSNRQMPYLLRCPLPSDTKDVPVAVSLTSEPCGHATNLLKVFGEKQREVSAYRNGKIPNNHVTLVKGWSAAVCGPALFYYHEDFSLRLVEWLELMRAQGFSKVFLYVTNVHPNITKVLRHYTQEGFVQVTDYNYPPPYINEPNLRRLWVLVQRPQMFAQENVYFTDCVLRHMHEHRFLVHLDPDEVPILPKHDNFTHLLDSLIEGLKGRSPPPGYRLQWSYFFNNLEPSEKTANLPSHLWALRRTGRQADHFSRPSPGTFKSIYDMNAVRGVFSHGVLLCLSGKCGTSKMQSLAPTTAFVGHFKHTCDKKCKKSVVHDLTLQKYKEQVSARVQMVLTTLKLL